MVDVKVGDRIESVGSKRLGTVTKVGTPSECFPGEGTWDLLMDDGEVVERALLHLTESWRRLPSSQPEKVEPRVPQIGDVWLYTDTTARRVKFELTPDGARALESTVPSMEVGSVHHNDLDFWHRNNKPVSTKYWTLISTGEAEKPVVCGRTWEGGRAPCVGPKGHSGYCSNVEGMKWELGPTTIEIAKPDSEWAKKVDAEVAAKMQAHNDAFHDKQKGAILGRWLEQKREPAYQPHWQRTGAVSTYSRRVPR